MVCPSKFQESESEELLDEEGDDDVEEDHDHEAEVQEQPDPIVKKPVETSQAVKETERQLSKKERKKKELAELDAILADLGVTPTQKEQDESTGNIYLGVKIFIILDYLWWRCMIIIV